MKRQEIPPIEDIYQQKGFHNTRKPLSLAKGEITDATCTESQAPDARNKRLLSEFFANNSLAIFSEYNKECNAEHQQTNKVQEATDTSEREHTNAQKFL